MTDFQIKDNISILITTGFISSYYCCDFSGIRDSYYRIDYNRYIFN